MLRGSETHIAGSMAVVINGQVELRRIDHVEVVKSPFRYSITREWEQPVPELDNGETVVWFADSPMPTIVNNKEEHRR